MSPLMPLLVIFEKVWEVEYQETVGEMSSFRPKEKGGGSG